MILSAAACTVGWANAYAQVTGTWNGNDTANSTLWSDALNWSGGVVPGATTGTTSTATALFNSTPSSNVVTIDPNRNIENIVFDTNATDFEIGQTANVAPSILLTGGGEIDQTSAVNASGSQIINDPLVIEGSSYTIINNANGSNVTGLMLEGDISGGTSGPTTLTLEGDNEVSSKATNSQIGGALVNGASSALSLVVNATASGVWELNDANASDPSTYTGTTTVTGGTLSIGSAYGISPNTDVTLANGTVLLDDDGAIAAPFAVVHSVTADGDAEINGANGNYEFDINTTTGPALVLNTGSITSEEKDVDAVIGLEGTGPTGTGGLLMVENTNSTQILEDEKTLDLGNVSRDFYITQGNDTTSSPTDLQLTAPITGNGGIIKSGAGVMKLESNATYSFAGQIEVQEGQFKMDGNPAQTLSGNSLLVDGGQLNLDGGNYTFGAATFTNGSTIISTDTNNNLGAEIVAPSFTFSVASGYLFEMNNAMADDTSPSAVLVEGSGTTQFAVNNLYSGGTTINGGTLQITAGNLSTSTSSPAYTGTPLGVGSVTMNGGTLLLSPNVNNGASAAAIDYQVANNSTSNTFTYAGGATINMTRGGETSVELSIGNASATSQVLVRADRGTLVLVPSSGNANLGTLEQVVPTVAPTVINGIVNPSIVTQNNDSNESGDFVAWNSSEGLVTYTGYTNTITAGGTAIFQATATSTNTLSANASLYGVSSGNTTTGGQNINLGGFTLAVGDNTVGNQAGVIMNGGSITNGTLAFGNDEGVVYTSLANASISANITDSGPGITSLDGLTIFGPGTLALTGNNSFTGGLTINQGVLNVSADANLGSATSNNITFGGGTLQFASSFNPSSSRAITLDAGGGTIDTQANSVTIASTIGGVGNLTMVGSGTLTLSGTDTYQGSTTIGAGTLKVTGSGSLGTGSGGVVNNGTLIFNSSSGLQSVSGAVSGSGTLTQSGAGSTVMLSGSNTYTGLTTISGGTVQLGNANALGFGGPVTNTVAGATVSTGGVLDLDGQTITKDITLNGGTLTNSGGAGGFSGGVAGYIVNSGGAGISADLTSVSGGGGTGAQFKFLLGLTNYSFQITTAGAGYSSDPTVTISGGGGTGATATATESGGEITAITIDDPGSGYWGIPTITLSGGGSPTTAAVIAGNDDDFAVVGTEALLPGSGYTSAPNATWYLYNSTPGSTPTLSTVPNSLALTTPVAPSITAVLDPLYVQSSSTINGSGAIDIPIPVTGEATSGTAVLDLDGTSAGDTISGAITDGSGGGNLGILKSNTSTWTLDAANSYSGGTTVSGGTLVAAVAGALPNGKSLVNNGTVDIYGNETLGASGVSAVTGNGALSIGNGPAIVVHLAVGSGAASQGSLSIDANASLDLGNNHIILSGDANGTLDSTIEGYLAAGYNGGGWNGTSANGGAIITSASTGTTYGIGWADGATGGISGISSGQLEIKYTLYGDTNLDGVVTGVDFGNLAANFGKSGSNIGWAQGAFTYNNSVTGVDFGLLAGNFGKSLGSAGDVATAADWAALDAFAEANGLMSYVPEPTSVGLFVLAGLGALAIRRRRTPAATK